jgi:hypothetical protein
MVASYQCQWEWLNCFCVIDVDSGSKSIQGLIYINQDLTGLLMNVIDSYTMIGGEDVTEDSSVYVQASLSAWDPHSTTSLTMPNELIHRLIH